MAGQFAVTISSAAPPGQGRELRACGSCTALGDWDVKRAPRLQAVDGKAWEGSYALTVRRIPPLLMHASTHVVGCPRC